MKEADTKRTIADYLEVGMAQGKWYADRLNSGEVIEVRGNTRRRVKLCRTGTADFFVLKGREAFLGARLESVIFLEVKGDKGMQRQEQKDFQELIEAQGAEYYVVRSVEEVQEIFTK